MGIISHKHNEIHNLKNVRFSFLECYNDPEVSHALISAIENWGREKGMNKIIGPFGFSDRDVQGLLIEGHEFEPVVDSACNFEFLPELVIREGYEKDADLVIYRYPLDLKLPDILYKIYDRVIAKKDFQFLEFTSRKPFKPLIVPVLRLVNETFSDLYGFVPMDEPEMKELAKRYMPILDPRFVKIVMKDGEVVAFLVSMPNLYRGIQKAKGRLFPFGIFHILYAMKHAKSTSLMLGAVKPAYRGKGLDVFFTLTTIESAKKAGMTSVDTHVVMEENDEMMGELKKYGAFLLKKFRVYGKSLD
jgi:ribosomal protein S18 acetylase RimI-like enzyme